MIGAVELALRCRHPRSSFFPLAPQLRVRHFLADPVHTPSRLVVTGNGRLLLATAALPRRLERWRGVAILFPPRFL
jgi:hypothetical protein